MKRKIIGSFITGIFLLASLGLVDAALQLSVAARNARLDAIETAVGTAPVLKIKTGAAPATCATADSGTVLATMTLPSDWMAAASSGAKAKSGTWQDTSADGTGTAAHFRLYASDGTTCHLQGTVTATSGGGDMELDNTSIATGQTVTVTAFSLTDGNAFCVACMIDRDLVVAKVFVGLNLKTTISPQH